MYEPCKQCKPPDPLYRVDTEKKIVYLTFDDGPYIEPDINRMLATTVAPALVTTEQLLDRLDALRDKVSDPELSATFFINGWAFTQAVPGGPADPTHPDAVRRREVGHRILAEGHDLANHTHHHHVWSNPQILTLAEMITEICLTQEAIQLIPDPDPDHPKGRATRVGEKISFFRSPGDPSYFEEQRPARPLWNGQNVPAPRQSRFKDIVTLAAVMGLQYASFNIWAKDDTLDRTAEWVYWHVMNVDHWNRNLAPSGVQDKDLLGFDDLIRRGGAEAHGAIILMHNGRAQTLDALDTFEGGIIPKLYELGYAVRGLSFPL